MNPIITDRDTGRELWMATDCANHCGISTATWRSYTRTGNTLGTPTPVAHLNPRLALWDALEVQEWHAARPGSPVRNAPGGK